MRFKFKQSSRTKAGLLAGACFIGLAIYSWGLPVTTALLFLAICLVFLLIIVIFAAILGYAFRCLRNTSDDI